MIRVLIVDDAAFMRQAIRNILGKNGFDVVADVGSGREAVEKYKKLRPHIVLMDVTMPGMTGIEAMQEIQAYDPRAMVVMVTAMGQESIVKDAILKGAMAFILKPFTEEHLTQTLRRVASGG